MQRVKGLKQLSGKKSVKKKQPKGFPAEYQTIKISNAFQMAVESKLPVVIDVKTDIAGIAPKAWN